MLNCRLANPDDLTDLVEMVEIASGGIVDFLLDGLVCDESQIELLMSSFLDPESNMFYENFIIAEEDGKTVGSANYYPFNQHGVIEAAKAFIPEERLVHLGGYLNSVVEDSLYIHTMAVLEQERYKSAAIALYFYCQEIAKELGFNYLSAHVWKGNKKVVTTLRSLGFEIIEEVDIEDHELFQYKGGMYLFRSKKLEEMVANGY